VWLLYVDVLVGCVSRLMQQEYVAGHSGGWFHGRVHVVCFDGVFGRWWRNAKV
jgi:hypothetical protein